MQNDSFSLTSHQIEALTTGSIAIFPTETIYGIGCSAWSEQSLQRIFQIKGRAPDQPPPILIDDRRQLSTLVAEVSPLAANLMEKYWPGSMTLILPAHPDLAASLSGFSADGKIKTVGVRQTDHLIAREICRQIGAPFIATSANFSGATGRAAAPHLLDDIPEDFRRQVDIIIDGGVLRGTPSTIVDCVGIPPRVIRLGAVELSDEELLILRET